MALYATALGGGAFLAAVYNFAWLIAGVFALLLLVAVVGGFRVWSHTEHALAKASSRAFIRQSPASRPARVSLPTASSTVSLTGHRDTGPHRAGRERQRSVANEAGGKLGEDRQVGMPLDAADPAHPEAE